MSDIKQKSNAATRNYNDLDFAKFLSYFALLNVAQKTLQHPLNMVTVRKQACVHAASRSTLHLLRETLRLQGPRGLFCGAPAFVGGVAGAEVGWCGLLESFRHRVPLPQGFSDAFASTFADALVTVILMPPLVVASRQIAASTVTARRDTLRMFPTARETAQGLWQEGGVRPFFRGLGISVVVGSSLQGVWFSVYQQLKHIFYAVLPELMPRRVTESPWLPEAIKSTRDNLVANLTASACASVIQQVLWNPFMVVRTVIQINPQQPSWLGAVRTLYGHEGWRGFYKGLSVATGMSIIDGFLLSSCYELAKKWADIDIDLDDDE